MEKFNISRELFFKTARSGGKGGQNVNKVETMVEAYFNVRSSSLLTEEQKSLVLEKLANKINAEGLLMVKSQSERTQLNNKHQAIKKINELINRSLAVQPKRKPTKPTAASKQKRIEQKKMLSKIKDARKKVRFND